MFGQSIEKEWLYRHPCFEEAESRLIYVAESGEALAVVLAEDGAGRSTLMKSVYNQRSQQNSRAVLLSAAACNQTTILKQLCRSLTIDAPDTASAGDLMLLIQDEIRGLELCGQHTTVLIDDLHRADEDLYGILRFLAAVNQQTGGAVSVIAGTSADDRSASATESTLKIELKHLNEVEAVKFLATGLGSLGHLDRIGSDAILAAVKFSSLSPGSLRRRCMVIDAALNADSRLVLTTEGMESLFQETLQRSTAKKAA